MMIALLAAAMLMVDLNSKGPVSSTDSSTFATIVHAFADTSGPLDCSERWKRMADVTDALATTWPAFKHALATPHPTKDEVDFLHLWMAAGEIQLHDRNVLLRQCGEPK